VPGVELRRIAQLARALDGDDRDLLGDVLGGRMVSEDAERGRAGHGEGPRGEVRAHVGPRSQRRDRDHVAGFGLGMLHRRHQRPQMWQCVREEKVVCAVECSLIGVM